MQTRTLIFLFLAFCAAGVLASLVTCRRRQGLVLAWFGSLAGLALVGTGGVGLLGGPEFHQALWTLPGWGTLTLHLDRLSAVFVGITGLVLVPASIFASSELRHHPDTLPARPFTLMLFGLYAATGLIFIAGGILVFLFAWEVMSILCYLLVLLGRKAENGRADAGFLLLAMGEAGTLAAAIGLLLLAAPAGALDFTAIKFHARALTHGARWAVFLLTFFGFGVKAGLVPVNFWLPRAYTAAPRAFTPVLAGATLNLGLYGILRVNADLLPPISAGPGLVALIIGTLSALVGILYATTENDLKTLLAHSSIENVGIVVTGFGAGMVFVATRHPAPAAIAWVAALYHLANHSLYKTLLFCGAGAVEGEAGTRDLDRLGGLIKWMPWTAAGMLIGALSIAGLPPFNGFVSEWLTLQTLLRAVVLSSTAVKMVFALCGAGLALTAALAVTCFVKMFGMGFLGMRRLPAEQQVNEARAGALVPMGLLAALCLLFGVLPTYLIPAFDVALRPLAGASAATALVPPFYASHPAHAELPAAFVSEFHDLGAQVGQSVLPGRGLVVMHRGGKENPVVFAMSTAYTLVILAGLLLLTYVVVRWVLTRDRQVTRRPRWDGGVRRLLPEMTYTATGFSNPVRVVFDAIFRPTTVEDTRETVAQHFRTAIRREKEHVYLADRLLLRPVRAGALWLSRALAAMHHGRINAYIAYVLLALLVGLSLTLLR